MLQTQIAVFVKKQPVTRRRRQGAIHKPCQRFGRGPHAFDLQARFGVKPVRVDKAQTADHILHCRADIMAEQLQRVGHTARSITGWFIRLDAITLGHTRTPDYRTTRLQAATARAKGGAMARVYHPFAG